MITGLSKAVALYLAPLMGLTSLVLSLLVFLAPSLTLQGKVALLSVTPSTVLRDVHSNDPIDGPSVWMGVIGSCSRNKNDNPLNCTLPAFSPQYDLSVLKGTPKEMLNGPSDAMPVFLAISLIFTIIFFILFTLVSLKHKMGAFGGRFQNPMIQRVAAWIGMFGFVFGLSSYLFLRLWFSKAVEDFNAVAAADGQDVIAATSNGFIMIWVAYAFYGVPLVCALANLHATAGGKSAA